MPRLTVEAVNATPALWRSACAGGTHEHGSVPMHRSGLAILPSRPARRGSCLWTVDHAGWVVTRHAPEEHASSRRTGDEVLAWHLVWLMRPERAVAPFLALAPPAAGCGLGAR
jgi:hypothetical protein